METELIKKSLSPEFSMNISKCISDLGILSLHKITSKYSAILDFSNISFAIFVELQVDKYNLYLSFNSNIFSIVQSINKLSLFISSKYSYNSSCNSFSFSSKRQ